jgi:predicted Zn finger-like uncharacterized protein
MPVSLTCPSCASSLRVPDSAAGRKVKCPKCGSVIGVPAAGEEIVDRATLGVKAAEAPGPASAAPTSRRRQAENEDEDAPRASRSRREYDDDDDDDYDDEPRYSHRAAALGQGGGLQLGLGIASLSVGILGLLISWIPVFGALICGVGLVLGVVAVIVAISNGRGYGFPIAGSAVSGVALAISLILTIVIVSAAQNMAQEMERQMGQNMNFGPPIGPPTPPAGAITLAGGKGQLERELTIADPFDRVQLQSRCKVFTVNMKAGRTYQIDMIRKENRQMGAMAFMDPFLRLEDANGNQLMFDDDGGGGQNARITFVCAQNGTFRVVATTLIGMGAFTLKVEER